MYKKHTKKLEEFIKVKAELDKRINEFKKEIEKKEVEFKELQEQYTKDFINGKTPDDKKLKTLKNDIETDKEQLILIIDGAIQDDKLQKLGQEVFTEHIAMQVELKKDLGKDDEEIKELERNYKKQANEIIKRKYKRVTYRKENAEERLKAIEYMDIDDKRKTRLKHLATDLQWHYIESQKNKFNL